LKPYLPERQIAILGYCTTMIKDGNLIQLQSRSHSQEPRATATRSNSATKDLVPEIPTSAILISYTSLSSTSTGMYGWNWINVLKTLVLLLCCWKWHTGRKPERGERCCTVCDFFKFICPMSCESFSTSKIYKSPDLVFQNDWRFLVNRLKTPFNRVEEFIRRMDGWNPQDIWGGYGQ